METGAYSLGKSSTHTPVIQRPQMSGFGLFPRTKLVRMLFKNEENATDNEDDTIEESDYNALEELKEDNRKFYEKEALEYSDVEIEEEETEKIPPTPVDKKQES